MDKFLFKISLKATDGWSKYYGETVKPVYFVARNKDEAKAWAESNVEDGLTVRSISVMARQLAPHVYTGEIKPRK